MSLFSFIPPPGIAMQEVLLALIKLPLTTVCKKAEDTYLHLSLGAGVGW